MIMKNLTLKLCEQPVIDAVLNELAPIRERATYYEENPDQVRYP